MIGRGLALLLVSFLILPLSGCATTSNRETLTVADIPSFLGLQENRTAEAGLLRNAHAADICQGASASVSAFTPPGQNLSRISGSIAVTDSQVLSDEVTCPNATSVNTRFQTNLKAASKTTPFELVDGIGAKAFLFSLDPDARSYAVEWLHGATLGFVVVQGPTADSHITPELAVVLARKAVTRSDPRRY